MTALAGLARRSPATVPVAREFADYCCRLRQEPRSAFAPAAKLLQKSKRARRAPPDRPTGAASPDRQTTKDPDKGGSYQRAGSQAFAALQTLGPQQNTKAGFAW